MLVSGVDEKVTWFVLDPMVMTFPSLPFPSNSPSSKSTAYASIIASISSIESVFPFLCLLAK